VGADQIKGVIWDAGFPADEAFIIMPPENHGLLRRRVAQVEVSDPAVNCLIAQAWAESLVEALGVLMRWRGFT